MGTEPVVPRSLPVVGGHLALDFANTVDDPLGPARHDHVADPAGLVAWARRVGVVDESRAGRLMAAAEEHPRAAAAAVRRAHRLRDVLNEVFGAAVEGTPLDEPWRRLRPFVTEAVAAAGLAPGPGGAAAWSWPASEDLAELLHPVAAAAADLLRSPDLARVSRCARCPWLFLDRSRNHSRRWCDMGDCGQAQKIERITAARAARRRQRDAPARS
ncbi:MULTISPECIES: CGNR zinc finger domain-containing protein [unclassified Blastococcus]